MVKEKKQTNTCPIHKILIRCDVVLTSTAGYVSVTLTIWWQEKSKQIYEKRKPKFAAGVTGSSRENTGRNESGNNLLEGGKCHKRDFPLGLNAVKAYLLGFNMFA